MKCVDVKSFAFVVSTLPGFADVGLAQAAAAAGATAVLNLEGVRDAEASIAALVRAPAARRFGVRVTSPEQLRDVHEEHRQRLCVIVLAGEALSHGGAWLDGWRTVDRSILIEATSVDEARAGLALGGDGVIAKGNEAGGRVGEETTLVLVQRLLAELSVPVLAHGGIGVHTVGACFTAGCHGVVLDSQMLLARESSLSDPLKAAIGRLSGDETVCIGDDVGARYRLYRRPGSQVAQELLRFKDELAREESPADGKRARWLEAVRAAISWSSGRLDLVPLGQDAAFAVSLARTFRSVPGILRGLRDALTAHVREAVALMPLQPDAPLARAHGTRYPILQGPMTRVSDTAAFAQSVAESGGLPFLALALLRGPQVRALLEETRERLGARPWGVGILGFVPLALREEQLAEIEAVRPAFALIAGGRPDQAAKLEGLGIATYLHVAAPALLKTFLDHGARRFVFEGRECGGHVGPRSSFVLWQLVVDVLLDAIGRGVAPEELHVVCAGGIHDARSAAMVSTIVAPLARLGVRVGVLIGTAYLFTEEAVAAGAIVETFQQEALACGRTVVLETGPGHETRCVDTEFCRTFAQKRREMRERGASADEIRNALEMLNLGRLRIASKGITREEGAEGAAYVTLDADEQRANGMYMIGQVAALRDRVCRIADLHEEVATGSAAWLAALSALPETEASAAATTSLAADVAIIGLGCLLPDALDVRTLWQNVLDKHDAIREVPAERFQVDRYYDPDRRARDKIYSRWGGFLPDVVFDPMKFGIPPTSVPSIDPFQLLTLEVVDQALRDAGYSDRPFDRERTSVILGASGGVGDLGFRYGIRAGLPMYLENPPAHVLDQLPEWTEDSFAGVLLNVAAGRVANRLDLGGLNFTVDAACASSLAAVYLGARELESGSSDMVIVGGIDTVNSPFGFLCFSSAQALSPRGRCSTFDQSADGIAISEGLVVLVLKRVADAERDGDRIYAVVRGVAGSSDGRGKGLTAPRPEGQTRVLQRAYAAAGIAPPTVGLIEAHGTGTVAGDGAEVAALSRVFGAAGAAPGACAIGSIKSMVGHTKSAAGVAGLLKVALSLHHKVLPPTLNVTQPNAQLSKPESPFFVSAEALPWIAGGTPRRAGVSSFGFGGTNFHVVVEEYTSATGAAASPAALRDLWPAELFVWTAPGASQLIAMLDGLEQSLSTAGDVPLRTIAAAVGRASATALAKPELRLAIVAANVDDLRHKIGVARESLRAGKTAVAADDVIMTSAASPGKVAFLYPGQGSQYPYMHRELAMHFADVREAIEVADQSTAGQFPRALSTYVFPAPAFSEDARERQMRDLTDTAIAQPALGAVETGLTRLLARFGLHPDLAAGHSYGEYVALWAAGVVSTESLFLLSATRGALMKQACGEGAGTMAAVSASADAIVTALGDACDYSIANFNSTRQTVIAGPLDAIEAAIAKLGAAQISARRIPVACAFHSPLVEPARQGMEALLRRTPIRAPRLPVFSNLLAAPYPVDPDAVRQTLAEHVVRPVRFVEEIERMYEAGVRVFVEVGPRAVLTTLARDILAGRDVRCVALDGGQNGEMPVLLRALGQCFVAGVALDLEPLWSGRSIPLVRIDELASVAKPAPVAHAWAVNGGRSRPLAKRPEGTDRKAPAAELREPPPPTAAPAATAVERPQRARSPSPRPPVARAPAPPTATAAAPRSLSLELVQQQHSTSRSLTFQPGGAMHRDFLPPRESTVAEHDTVMRQFQHLMSQFLHTQAVVMTTYLQGAPPAGLAAPPPAMGLPMPATLAGVGVASAAAVVAPERETPGFAEALPMRPREPLRDEARAASPVPTPAPPEVRTMAPPAPVAVSAAPAPVSAPARPQAEAVSEADVLRRLVRIVADRTGYPEEMLPADADIEADLGIDSIKRMEVLAAFNELHGGGERTAFQGALERLTALKTLRESAAALTELLGTRPAAAVA